MLSNNTVNSVQNALLDPNYYKFLNKVRDELMIRYKHFENDNILQLSPSIQLSYRRGLNVSKAAEEHLSYREENPVD
jgi:hypothetical protein